MSKRIVLALALGLTISSSAFAAPSIKVYSSDIDFKEAVTPEMIAKAKDAIAEKKKTTDAFAFALSDINDADLKAFAEAFPEIKEIEIESDNITSIAPLANLKGLTAVDIEAENLSDLSPLANLVALEKIKAEYNAKGQNFEWMSKLTNLKNIDMKATGATSTKGLPSLPNLKTITLDYINVLGLTPLVQAMPNLQSIKLHHATIGDLSALVNLPNLKKVDLYGATVKDFSPLAKAPKLEDVHYYAVKGADFSTLGTLTQVKTLDGGLTMLDSLAWLKDMPKLERLRVFAEYVTDYTPLKNAPNLNYLHIWKMREPVGDLAFLAPLTNLTELRINGNKGVQNYEAIGNLTKLKNLIISSNDEKEAPLASFAFLPKLTELQTLDIDKTYVENFDVTGLTRLNKISLGKVNMKENQAPIDLSSIKNLPELARLEISECHVANFEALSNLPKIKHIDLRKTKGITDLAPLKAFTNVTLFVTKGAFTDEQLAELPSTVKVRQY